MGVGFVDDEEHIVEHVDIILLNKFSNRGEIVVIFASIGNPWFNDLSVSHVLWNYNLLA